ATTNRISFKTPQRVKTREEVFPICIMLARVTLPIGSGGSYQGDNRNIQGEGYTSVEKQCKEANIGTCGRRDVPSLEDYKHEEVHDSTNWGKVKEGHQRIHLVLWCIEQSLDHNQSCSLKDNTKCLEDESDEDKVNLAIRSNDNT